VRRSKPGSGETLLTGILLLVFGAAVWGIGGALGSPIAILVGVLLFVGGILLFFGAITGALDKL